MQSIKLFEHEKVKLSELSISLSPKEINDFQRLLQELKRRDTDQREIIKFHYKEGKPFALQTLNFVGVIQVGNKSIQIMPKLARAGSNGEVEMATGNLLFMLEYTGKMKIGNISSANLMSDRSNFYEVLIYLFASNLLQILKNDLYQEYSLAEENLGYIKGKINFGNHIRLNSISKHKFYVEYDDFNENNTLNQTLKMVSYLLSKISRSIQNLQLLQEINFIFADVELRHVGREEVERIKLDRITFKYEYALNLCRLFLANSSIQLATGTIKSFSFLIDMNVLFEEFIAVLLRRECKDRDLVITAQRPIKPFVIRKIATPEDSRSNLFMLRPDIVCKRGDKVELIIDTKYKVLDRGAPKEGIKQPDLYQMFAYSKKYDCPNVVLLYPELPETEYRPIEFEIDSFTSIKLVSIGLCTDLKLEYKKIANLLLTRLGLNANQSSR